MIYRYVVGDRGKLWSRRGGGGRHQRSYYLRSLLLANWQIFLEYRAAMFKYAQYRVWANNKLQVSVRRLDKREHGLQPLNYQSLQSTSYTLAEELLLFRCIAIDLMFFSIDTYTLCSMVQVILSRNKTANMTILVCDYRIRQISRSLIPMLESFSKEQCSRLRIISMLAAFQRFQDASNEPVKLDIVARCHASGIIFTVSPITKGGSQIPLQQLRSRINSLTTRDG